MEDDFSIRREIEQINLEEEEYQTPSGDFNMEINPFYSKKDSSSPSFNSNNLLIKQQYMFNKTLSKIIMDYNRTKRWSYICFSLVIISLGIYYLRNQRT